MVVVQPAPRISKIPTVVSRPGTHRPWFLLRPGGWYGWFVRSFVRSIVIGRGDRQKDQQALTTIILDSLLLLESGLASTLGLA
jgi:hypothetical protein